MAEWGKPDFVLFFFFLNAFFKLFVQCLQQLGGLVLQICSLHFFLTLSSSICFPCTEFRETLYCTVRPVTWEHGTLRAFWAFCLLTFLGWSIPCRHSSEDDFNWGIKHWQKPDSLFSCPSAWRRTEGGRKLPGNDVESNLCLIYWILNI